MVGKEVRRSRKLSWFTLKAHQSKLSDSEMSITTRHDHCCVMWVYCDFWVPQISTKRLVTATRTFWILKNLFFSIVLSKNVEKVFPVANKLRQHDHVLLTDPPSLQNTYCSHKLFTWLLLNHIWDPGSSTMCRRNNCIWSFQSFIHSQWWSLLIEGAPH